MLANVVHQQRSNCSPVIPAKWRTAHQLDALWSRCNVMPCTSGTFCSTTLWFYHSYFFVPTQMWWPCSAPVQPCPRFGLWWYIGSAEQSLCWTQRRWWCDCREWTHFWWSGTEGCSFLRQTRLSAPLNRRTGEKSNLSSLLSVNMWWNRTKYTEQNCKRNILYYLV